jgi:MFS family permease
MSMKLFYGWVIVGVGIVVSCVGMGTMMSLGVFLQPLSQEMGWSRAGVAVAAVLNFLCMGAGSLFWGSLSDRYGTRAVVLIGGVLLGAGVIATSYATSLLQFQLLFGVAVGLAVSGA